MKHLLIVFFLSASPTYGSDRNAVYSALKGSSIELLNEAVDSLLKTDTSSINNGYLGALYMKRSLFIHSVKQKMDSFKMGKELLETEITKSPNNVEFRFLRLIIQENAPPIVKYNKNIKEDGEFIYNNFGKIDKALQDEIIRFSAHSLHLEKELLIAD